MSEDAAAPPPAPRVVPPLPAPPPIPWRERYKGLEALKDNIEAFTIALVMALVIKHFCVEAFKIPTDSMYPTLYGEGHPGAGDRILVDKWAYLTSDPSRWDVVVFRFPLNKSKHFIKRVAGVGGEWIRIERGDVWTRATKDEPWRIATKPRRPRDELYLPVFPPTHDEFDDLPARIEDTWTLEGGVEARSLTELHFVPSGGSARYAPRITDASLADAYGSWGGKLVQDVRVRLRVDAAEAGWLELSWSTAEGHEASLRLTAAADGWKGHAHVKRPGLAERADLEAPRSVGTGLDVEFEAVDGQVRVHLDGREVAVLDEERAIDSLPAFDDFTQRLQLEAGGGAVEVTSFSIDRDVYYGDRGMEALVEGDDGLWIPEDRYFMLGDNTDSSHDSRKWTLEVIPLGGDRSVRYYYDRNAPPRPSPGGTTVVDQEGIEREYPDEAARERTEERVPFVDRELIVGKAFFIFWPLYPDPPGRAGLIH